MRAPSRASDTVSVPMWHCRWTPSSPETSPRRGTSNRTTRLRNPGSSVNRATEYPGEATWAGTRSSQLARLTSIELLTGE